MESMYILKKCLFEQCRGVSFQMRPKWKRPKHPFGNLNHVPPEKPVTKEERQKLVPTSTIVQKLNLSTGVEKTNQPVEKTFQTETKRKLHILYQHGLGKITVVIRSWFLELNLTWSPCNSIVKSLIEHEE